MTHPAWRDDGYWVTEIKTGQEGDSKNQRQ